MCNTLYGTGLSLGAPLSYNQSNIKDVWEEAKVSLYVKMNPPHGDSSLTSPHFLWESWVVWEGVGETVCAEPSKELVRSPSRV